VTRIALARLAVLAGLLAAWELWASRGNPLLYVPPSRVWPAFVRVVRLEAYPTLLAHFGLTAFEVLVAYLLAVGLGLDHVAAAALERAADLAFARDRLPSRPAHRDLMLAGGDIHVRDAADFHAVDRLDAHVARAPGAHHRGIRARQVLGNALRAARAAGEQAGEQRDGAVTDGKHARIMPRARRKP